jgi:putative DNA primase/helicase
MPDHQIKPATARNQPPVDGGASLREFVLDYFQQDWMVMRLLPQSKEPDRTKTHDALTITRDNLDTLAANENIGVRFKSAGALKDVDLDYQSAVDLADAVGLPQATAAFGRKSVGIGHLLYNSAGAKAKKFVLPDVKEYPRDLPMHDGKPSLTVLEIRGTDNTYTMFPPSVHPCGETLAWLNSQRQPTEVTPDELCKLAGLHAFASTVLYFYPVNAAACYEVRMALAGTLVRAGVAVAVAERYGRVDAVEKLFIGLPEEHFY